MDILADLAASLVAQFQKPTLAFLIGGMFLAALGSKLEIPAPIYRFIVVLLLLKIGIGGGMAVRQADLAELAVPAFLAAALGVAIVLLGRLTLGRARRISPVDSYATAGLFGAVSASTLAAAMAMLDGEGIGYEGYIGALYPFMDIAALVSAIVLARLQSAPRATLSDGALALGGVDSPCAEPAVIRGILVDTLRSPAISALLLGLALGLLARPDPLYDGFFEPMFRGLLAILMLTMGMEAWSRLSELRSVAHAYVGYALTAPLVHGALGFGAGVIAHHTTGFSGGGVVLLAVMAASSSDISGPPTLRAALPEANASAYIGSSTGLGTPVALLSIPLWIALFEVLIGL